MLGGRFVASDILSPVFCVPLCLKLFKNVLEEGYMKLKVAFKTISPNVSYTALHGRSKLLQMPLATLGIRGKSQGNYCIFLEEKHSTVLYNNFKSLLNN